MKNILLLFITVLSAACTDGNHVQTYRYEEIKTGKCSADPLNTFHYTMPEKNTGKLPLLIILDSGGDGLFAVKKVLPAAGLPPCIMVGSDLIKNNFPGFLQAAGVLIEEAIRRF